MSDFFSGIYNGIKRPDVLMNYGPLPPLSMNGGYPEGFNSVADGKINFASTLLGDLNPYAYCEAARLSSQTAYMNIPHVCQRIVPSLELPEAQPYKMGGSFVCLSHQVMRARVIIFMCPCLSKKKTFLYMLTQFITGRRRRRCICDQRFCIC